uniref:Uncharacterized protein n=1 Tax=Arundo donax TaxID=35708 RepID=A0A0A9CVA5_ARUDO
MFLSYSCKTSAESPHHLSHTSCRAATREPPPSSTSAEPPLYRQQQLGVRRTREPGSCLRRGGGRSRRPPLRP